MRTAKTLIRLGRCPGWSESSLGAHSFCWFCHEAAQLTIFCNFQRIFSHYQTWNEPQHDKTNKMTCAPSKDQPGHSPSPSLIRVFAVRMRKPWVLSFPLNAHWRLIILRGCAGWSESSLGIYVILLVLSCSGSNGFKFCFRKHIQGLVLTSSFSYRSIKCQLMVPSSNIYI